MYTQHVENPGYNFKSLVFHVDLTSSPHLSNEQIAVESSGAWINSHGTNLKNLHFTWTDWEWVTTKGKKHLLLWKIHMQYTKHSSLLQVTVSWDEKGRSIIRELVQAWFMEPWKTSIRLLEHPLCFVHPSCEHSREEAKVAQTPAGVKLFPQAISALSILAYDTCKLVNISSIVALMTVKACYLCFESSVLNVTCHWLIAAWVLKTSVTNVSSIRFHHLHSFRLSHSGAQTP